PSVIPNILRIVDETCTFSPKLKCLANIAHRNLLKHNTKIQTLLANAPVYSVGKIRPRITNNGLIISVNHIIAVQITEFKVARSCAATLNSVCCNFIFRLKDTIDNPTVKRSNRRSDLRGVHQADKPK